MNRALFSSMCLLALAAFPVTQAAEFDQPKKTEPTLEAIQKQLLDIQISLQSLKAQDTEVRLRKVELDLLDIKDQLTRLETTLKANASVDTRKSFSVNPPSSPAPSGTTPGTGPATAAVAPPSGTLRLSNTSAFYASVNVNGSSYRVAPGQLFPINNMPAGDFRYEVFADGFGLIQAPTSRTLAPGEIFTVFIYPRN